MLVRPRQGLESLSVSALDLFASALGVFMLVAILMFPYYLRSPSVEAALQGAQAEMAAAGRSLRDAEREAEAAERQKAQAVAALARARERLERAEAAAADAAAAEESSEPEPKPAALLTDQGSTSRRQGLLAINDLDLVFVMDTTGSMRGELSDLQANLLGILRILHRLAPTLRAGFVAFKDHGDAYVTKAFPLGPMETTHFQEIAVFVRQLSAEGGGDDPEPVDEALRAAIAMPWRSDAAGQIVVVGDAPPRTAGWQQAIELASGFQGSAPAGAPPRTVSAIFTGREPNARAFFERVADAGGGLFTPHQGRMIESVLLAVLQPAGEGKVARR